MESDSHDTPSSEPGTSEMASSKFPIISVANIHPEFDTVSKQLFDAACKWGFFIVTDHGITKADEVSELVSRY